MVYTYGSAFAGIGGMTMGLSPLGFKGVMAWEYDPMSPAQYAQEAHKLLHPSIPVRGDIRDTELETIPDMDLFCFTPPCQAFSQVGSRMGLEDMRGTLTFDALKIVKAKQPKVLFMENVRGLLSHDKGRTFETMIRGIQELGYVVDFNVLNAKYFGVPQGRQRLYMVAFRKDVMPSEPWTMKGLSTTLKRLKQAYQAEENGGTFNFNWGEHTEVTVHLRDILEENVPPQFYVDGKTPESGTLGNFFIRNSFTQEKRGNGFRFALHVKEHAEVAYTVTTRTGRRMDDNFVVENLPVEVPKIVFHSKDEFLQQLYVEDVPAYFGTENLQDVPQFQKAFTKLTQEDAMFETELPTIDWEKVRVRRITPREALMLQGVPEGYREKLIQNFDTIRLDKFAGNGLATPVIAYIGKEIKAVLDKFQEK